MEKNIDKLITYNYIYNKNYQYKSSKKTLSINFDYPNIITLKKIIEHTYSTKKTWLFKKDGILNYCLIINNNIQLNVLNEDSINYTTYITFTNNFSKISVVSYIYQEAKDKDLKKCLTEKNKEICKNIKEICKKIEKAHIEENYFFEPVQLCYGSTFGYYDFGRLVVDAGDKIDSYYNPEILKLKIRYSKVLIDDMPLGTPMCDTMMIDRIIIKNLMQLLLRFPIEEKISDGKYYSRKEFRSQHNYELDELNSGTTYKVNRNEIINNNFIGFPEDSKVIIEKFYNLDYKKKNVFLKSCTSYVNGLKSKSTKAIAYYVLAIENIANFNSKPSEHIKKQGDFYEDIKGNKKSKIYKVINNVFGKVLVSEDYINIIYKARSEHFHDGLENNDIIKVALEIDDSDSTLIDSVERLTHSFLIKWLLII